jgi:putative phosphoribosyl transferase
MIFSNRREAGKRLADELEGFHDEDPVVIGLPRGGVPVAFEVARALHAPLDVMVVRKVGAPTNPEYGIGAIAEEDVRLINRDDVEALHLSAEMLGDLVDREYAELQRRLQTIRDTHPKVDIAGRTVLMIDDGLATGITAVAAARAVRKRGAEKVVLAAPVCAASMAEALKSEVDEVLCAESPGYLGAVGTWYEDFTQTSESEVLDLLEENRRAVASK